MGRLLVMGMVFMIGTVFVKHKILVSRIFVMSRVLVRGKVLVVTNNHFGLNFLLKSVPKLCAVIVKLCQLMIEKNHWKNFLYFMFRA